MNTVATVGVKLDSRGAVSGLRSLDAQAQKTQGSFAKLKAAALAVGSAAAAIKGAQFVFAKTAELETQTRSLKVLTGSLQDAKKVIKELQDFGAVTPFTSSELIETAKRLKAFGFETEKIVDVTKRLGDIAGATGADLGGIATAFGQIQAKGRLQGEELLQLQERGVDLQGTLRKEYGLTADEFQTALRKGQIGADAVNFALERLTETGGKYAGGAIAQSDTLNGKMSTLRDGVDTLARTLGKVLSPAIKAVLNEAIAGINMLNKLIGIAQRAQKFGLDKGQQKAIRDQALAEAEEIVNLRNIANPFERNKVFQQVAAQRESDLLNAYGFETGLLQAEIPQFTGTTQPPKLGGDDPDDPTGGKRVDASKELLSLNKQLLGSTEKLSELDKILLNFRIEKQQIQESNLLANEKEIALLKATAGFEQDLLGYRQDQLDLQEKSAELSEQNRKRLAAEEKRRQEADPGFQMKQQLEELLDVQNQVAAGATAIGNAFAGAFTGVISGSKSAEDALKDMMAATAEHFLNMAAQIIAQQIAMIIYGTIMQALGVSLPSMGSGEAGVGSMADMGSVGLGGAGSVTNKMGHEFGTLGPNFGIRQKATGGYVSSPEIAHLGEGGEPEYVIPQSKMRESMSRYSRGVRGNAVVEGTGESGTTEDTAGLATSTPIDVRYTVDRINSVDYVTADQFQNGMRQAANQGAKQGEQQALRRLQMSGSTRKRLGM